MVYIRTVVHDVYEYESLGLQLAALTSSWHDASRSACPFPGMSIGSDSMDTFELERWGGSLEKNRTCFFFLTMEHVKEHARENTRRTNDKQTTKT